MVQGIFFYQVEDCFIICDLLRKPELLVVQLVFNPAFYFYIQICNETGTKWNYGEWLFTSKPGVFGMIGGCANPTGVALISILTIMVLCSLPCVRRSGRFEVSPSRIWVFCSWYSYIFFRSSQHHENMLCAKIVLTVKTKTKQKFMYTSCSPDVLTLQFSIVMNNHIIG